MRKTLLSLLAAVLVAVSAPGALAKFGMFKKKVTLHRVRPPQHPPIGETVALDVRSDAPEVRGVYVDLVRRRLEEVFGPGSPYRLADRTREADVVVRVSLEGLSAEVRDELRHERKSIKVGERDKWNEKKQRWEKEDVYEMRDVQVAWRIAEGTVDATLEVGSGRSADLSSSYDRSFRRDANVPSEAGSEESLRRFLVEAVAEKAAAEVAYSPDPVEALLAVNGELKTGNELAEAGLFDKALAEWTRRSFKGDTEAARLHNLGVAHEALAYRLPPHGPEHRAELEQARDHYRRATGLDPDEKYFREPVARIEVSLGYADNAARLMADLAAFKEQATRKHVTAASPPPRAAPAAGAPAPRATPTPKAKPSAQPALGGSASAESPLRNGSFESSLPPWALSGKGAVVEEAGRGRVLELAPATGAVSIAQSVGVGVPEGSAATLGLDYRVASGEGQIKTVLAYVDAAGKDRTATLQVSGGEGPGRWSPWSGDVAALRPRPSRVKEIRIVVEGGTVRVDNVALTVR